MSVTDPQTTIDCFVRASAAGKLVSDSLETLYGYGTDGTIDGVNVETWPDGIQLSDRTVDDFVEDLYEQFQWWASNTDCSLSPAFRLSERTTLVNERVETVLTLPVLCLTIRVDGDLVSVVPHRTDTGVYTVTDALSDIHSGDVLGFSTLSSTSPGSSELEKTRPQKPREGSPGTKSERRRSTDSQPTQR